MIAQEKLNRINQLAHKAKENGLTDDEKKEQKELREEYLQNVRKSFKNEIKSMTVKDPAGNDVTPQKVHDLRKKDE